MQILQLLFKAAKSQERKNNAVNHPPKSEDINGDADSNNNNAKGKEINLKKRDRAHKRTKRIEWSKFCCCHQHLKLLAFLYRKDISETCFYSTLSLRRLESVNKRDFVSCSTKMKKAESSREVGNANKKSDSGAHAGNKVSPVTEAPLSSSAKSNEQCDATETNKGNKKKPISRMKELLRWAASAKTEKGGKFNGRRVLMFRRRSGTLKEVPDGDEVCSDSPKISFRWDVESCSTISSTYSAISIASSAKNRQAQIAHSTRSIPPASETGSITCREENWITTDSEYVVLEL